MRPRPAVHLELPALPALSVTSDGVGAHWWQAVEAATRRAAPGVWFSAGPVAGAGRWCDPVVLAGGAVRIASRPMLGVISEVAAGRHPAVLAREITALDVVSKGRAAVLLTCRTPAIGDVAAADVDARSAPELMAEAAAVCRAVLCDVNPVFEGRYFHVAGAVNRPGPVRPGGPPLLAEVPPGWPELVEEDDASRDLGGRLVSAASAIVSAGGPAELVACRRALDRLQVPPAARSAETGDGPSGLWWRGPATVYRSPAHAAAFEESRVDGLVLQVGPAVSGDRAGDALVVAIEAALAPDDRPAC